MKTSMRSLSIATAVTFNLLLGTVCAQVMVKDIYPGAAGSSPASLTNANGTLFFKASDGTGSGVELWKSDGTAAGTVMVKDILVYASTSLNNLTSVNGTIYFMAQSSMSYPAELHKSDGTEVGTGKVKTLSVQQTGFLDSCLRHVDNLTNVNGMLYFTVRNGFMALWKSDGTPAGTVYIKDIRSGNHSSYTSFTNVNGVLCFVGDDGTKGEELWKSDGTTAGTVIVKDINAGTNASNPSYLTNVNGALYFGANDGTDNGALWKSDGTDAGTVKIKNVSPFNITNVNGTLYFGVSGTNGELWKSDGTTNGTVKIKDGFPGGVPLSLTNVNGTLFFIADDATHGYELWKSDGTSAGTFMIKDINPKTDNSTYISNMTNLTGTLYFNGNDGVNGEELWESDGTEPGTKMVKDIKPGASGSMNYSSSYLININDALYFSADDGTNGRELWKLGGTTSVREIPSVTPKGFSLDQNYPNPFNPETVISWQLAVNSYVSLKVFDVLGREVASFVNEFKPAGNYNVNFDASKLTSGIYFYQLRSGNAIDTKHMVLIK